MYEEIVENDEKFDSIIWNNLFENDV